MAFVKSLSRNISLMLRTHANILNPDVHKPVQFCVQQLKFSSSPAVRSLSEFFEDEKLRGEKTIRVGREWRSGKIAKYCIDFPNFRKDELRLKSNSDLHKLWFVLLKERNMLLTMEEAFKDKMAPMPNPERMDKVELSMEHLEEVVRERNRAYWQLEVGVSGERERVYRKDCFGRMIPYKPVEHAVPIWMNRSYRNKLKFRFQDQE